MNPLDKQYLNRHPVVFWLSLGIGLIGVYNLYFPIAGVAATEALDPTLLVFLNIMRIGGLAVCIGIVKCQPKLEASGCAFVATALLTQFAAVIEWNPSVVPSSIFLLTTGIGFVHRTFHLTYGKNDDIYPRNT